jgi:predicted MPP superfamily phosphohydrolase
MHRSETIFVLSDIHYASKAEKARGVTEFQIIGNPLLRLSVRAYRHFIWRRDPFAHNHLLDRFIKEAQEADHVVANGDYSCDTAFIGLSDPPSYESAKLCLDKLRTAFGKRALFTIGDHELGKVSLFGNRGGMRAASWDRTLELSLDPFWSREVGDYVLMGVASSLIALPVYEPEVLPEERAIWQELRHLHLEEIGRAFSSLHPSQRVLLFCHDPTALPFLWGERAVQLKLSQVAATIIGHLHSKLFFWESRVLAGMPRIKFLGNSIRRMSTALNEAKRWQSFRVQLCPSLAGIELLRDGGYLRFDLASQGHPGHRVHFRRFDL